MPRLDFSKPLLPVGGLIITMRSRLPRESSGTSLASLACSAGLSVSSVITRKPSELTAREVKML
eukprot:scaffold2582_cov162-Ochromonas_danica.AAC.17